VILSYLHAFSLLIDSSSLFPVLYPFQICDFKLVTIPSSVVVPLFKYVLLLDGASLVTYALICSLDPEHRRESEEKHSGPPPESHPKMFQ
jgi:hypothetical protein